MSDEGKLPMQSVFIVKKKVREPSWRWITIDATGQREELAVEKYEIIRSVHIHARDLRILDPNLCYPSTILVRERAIVINLEDIKAIITANKVYLRNNSDKSLNPVVEDLQRRLNVDIRKRHGQGDEKEESSAEYDDDGSPFEFRVLEVALEAICMVLAVETADLERAIYPALDALMNKINIRELNKLRKHKSTLNTLSSRVQKIRDELEKLLGDDDDMAELYLSRKLAGASSSPEISAKISRAKSHLGKPPGESDDVQDIEMLLEAYFIQIDSTLNNLTWVRNNFSDAEDYINVQLDTSRNELIKFELFLSTGSICISVYALVCGILGMNIPFSWNRKEYMFKWVVGVTATLCGVLFAIIMSYARYKRLVGI